MTDPATILCIGLGWFPTSPGGSERYVYELTHQLATNQDQVELCGVGLPETDPASTVQLTNLCEPDWSLWQRWHSTRQRFACRSSDRPDAINLHFPLYSFPLVSSLPAAPITFTFHGPWALEGKQEGGDSLNVFVKTWLERRLYQRCDRFITLSKAFATILHQRYRVDWDKIHVIPGGVNIERFQADLSRQQARQQLNFPQDRFILFTPRRLVQRMGLHRLLQAIALLKPKLPEIWLAIAGKGPLRDSLEQQARELGIDDTVKFLGYVPDQQLPVAYQAADLTVVLSQSLEGFGLVLLESLACGTPVLCTPVGGMPEAIAPFSPQLITESAEVEAIASKLHTVIQAETLPARSECREYAAANFNWKDIAMRVRQVLLA